MEMFWGVPPKTKKSQVKKWADKIGFEVIESKKQGSYTTYKLAEKSKGKAGQPPKKVTKEEILALRDKGNTMDAIAKMLGVSRKTLYNRIGKKRFPL